MCTNAVKTAAELMAGIRPTVVSLLTLEGVQNTPEAQADLAAFDAAETALQNWQQGTASENVVELVTDFTAAFNAVAKLLPVSPQIEILVNIISAGIVGVIAVIQSNSPTPAGTTTANYRSHVITGATLQVKELVPNVKYHKGFFGAFEESPKSQYLDVWNQHVEELAKEDEKYAALKQ